MYAKEYGESVCFYSECIEFGGYVATLFVKRIYKL